MIALQTPLPDFSFHIPLKWKKISFERISRNKEKNISDAVFRGRFQRKKYLRRRFQGFRLQVTHPVTDQSPCIGANPRQKQQQRHRWQRLLPLPSQSPQQDPLLFFGQTQWWQPRLP
jgi:hypothetical protein